MEIERNDIFIAKLYNKNEKSSVQTGIRPVYIVQNNKGNEYSSTVIIVPFTSKIKKDNIPTHVIIDKNKDFNKKSMLLCEQIQTIDKEDLLKKICHVYDKNILNKINNSLKISLDLEMEK